MRTTARDGRGRFGDQSGVGIVLVMGVGMLVMGMAFLAHSIFDGAITSSSGHVTYEQALHLAETGVDESLARISKNPAYANAVAVPATFDPALGEKGWVLQQAAVATPEKSPEGEFVAIKPPNRNVIYGVGWIGDRGSSRRTRVVKAEYLLSAYNPQNAILVGGPLALNGNPAVGGTAGNVHANDDINLTGNPQVTGGLRTTGQFLGKDPSTLPSPPGSATAGTDEVSIPSSDPLAEWYKHRDYGHFVAGNAVYEGWYDLCPDGIVRKPDGAAPCTGTVAPGSVAGAQFRGFKLSGAIWDYHGNSAYDGIYFAYRTSIKVTGNPGEGGVPWKATLFAEPGPDDGTQCPNLVGGDIDVSGTPRITPFLDGLTIMAGRDLEISGNSSAAYLAGLMMANEQLSVPGNPTLTGSLIAEGLCNTPGSLVDAADSSVKGNPTITHDGALEVKIGVIPRTTLWLEL